MRKEDANFAWESMWPILVEDGKGAIETARKVNTSTARRTAFRTLFACLEGAIYLQKLIPLVSAANPDSPYTPDEIALLREEGYQLDADGTTKAVKRFLRIEDNLLFTIRMVCKEAGINPEIDTNCEGWRALKASILLRHRVTHPQRPADLEVSAEDFERLVKGYEWGVGSLQRALARGYLALYAKLKEIKAEAARLRPHRPAS